MVCLHCGGETKVTNSRPQKRVNRVWRRRECLTCHATFTSEESALYVLAWVVEVASGHLQPFSRDKLLLSLHRSLEHRPTALEDAGALTDTAINRLRANAQGGRLSPATIAQVVQVALNRFDTAASVHYRAFHGG